MIVIGRVVAEMIVIQICGDTGAGGNTVLRGFVAIGRESVGGERVILTKTGRWIRRVPYATLGMKDGERGPSAIVAVVVLESGENGGQLDLCVGLLFLINSIPGRLVVRPPLLFGGRQVGGRERALLSTRQIAALGIRVGGGGTGHASGFRTGERVCVRGNAGKVATPSSHRIEQNRFSVFFTGEKKKFNKTN